MSSSPAIGIDGTVYVSSQDHNLYALNPGGTQKWAFTAANDLSSSPAIGSDGTIYFGCYDDNLYAVNSSGTLEWKFATGGAVDSSPAIGADGTIYVGSLDQNLYAVNPDGTEKWAFATGAILTSSPAIGADGTIYFGSYDDNLYALNPGGTLKWKFPTANGVDASPAIGADGTIYVGTIDTSDLLYAVTDGGQGVVSQKWAFKAGDDVESSPAIGSDGTIYVGSDDDNLYALNPDGTLKWTFATGAYRLFLAGDRRRRDHLCRLRGPQSLCGRYPESDPDSNGDHRANRNAHRTATPTPVPVTLEIKPKALRFPKTAVGTSSKPKTVKVSNPKGGKKRPGNPVLVEQISDPGMFTQTNNCPATLAAGADCTISVIFTPSAATKQRATMTITDNAKGTPQTVQLSGVGH